MSLQSRVSDLVVRIGTEFKAVKLLISGNNSGTLTSLTTTNKDSLLAALNEVKAIADGNQSDLGYTPEDSANKGDPNGYASLDGGGKVPSNQLPAYVDDIIEGDLIDSTTFNASGNEGTPDGAVTPASSIIYLDISSNLLYRWSGNSYVVVSSSLALGETSSTAYRGDRGKIAYDHSQISNANPHTTTFSQLSAKPTTISGFGITDAFTKTEIGDVTTNFVTTFESAL